MSTEMNEAEVHAVLHSPSWREGFRELGWRIVRTKFVIVWGITALLCTSSSLNTVQYLISTDEKIDCYMGLVLLMSLVLMWGIWILLYQPFWVEFVDKRKAELQEEQSS